jgi:hypothetical protein
MTMPKINVPRPVHICNCGLTAWSNLTKGYLTVVSIQDAHFLKERAWTATQRKDRVGVYAVSQVGKLHRLILNVEANIKVDHISGCGLDNRRENLRPSTTSQNGQNMRKPRKGTSQYKGVCWITAESKWMSYISVKGHFVHLGIYSCETEAAKSYDRAAAKYFGEFARLNFP